MKVNILNKKYLKERLNLFLLKIIIFIQIIKFCELSCDRVTPYLKGGICTNNCSYKEMNNDKCKVDNEIIKSQWINNIIYIGTDGWIYINMVTTGKNDLIAIVSKYPSINERIIYGLTKEGRGYFIENNQESAFHKMYINNEKNI